MTVADLKFMLKELPDGMRVAISANEYQLMANKARVFAADEPLPYDKCEDLRAQGEILETDDVFIIQ